MAYLSYRAPLPVNSNWYVAVHSHPVEREMEGKEKLDGIGRLSVLMSFVLDWKEKLEREELEVEMVGKKPLCMNQYTNIFSVTRIPREGVDELVKTPPEKSTHAIVLYQQQIFTFPLYHKGRRLNSHEIQSQFHTLIHLTSLPHFEKQEDVAILTSGERSEWARVRKALEEFHPNNKHNLELIDTSLFAIALDSNSTESADERAKLSLVGKNGEGRWFDKSFNLILYKDGSIGANGEHSPSDAPAPALVFQTAFARESKESYEQVVKTRQLRADYLPLPLHLKWNLFPSLLSSIRQAQLLGKELYEKTDVRVLRFSDYGSNFISSLQVPPDSWAQIAIQLSYFRVHGKLTAIYETGSTRGFKHGRTDTVRSLTFDVANFVNNFDDPNLSPLHKMKLFAKAVSSHREYLVASVRGQAIDRHFFGLKILASQLKIQVPFFSSYAFQETSNWRLSTSNMNPSDFWFCGFGAVVEDGYGICYCTRSDNLKFSIANFTKGNNNSTCAIKFREVLSKTLYDLREMSTLAKNDQPKL